MRGEETAIEIISEFMSPFEDSLTVLMLGDCVDDGTQEEIIDAFDRMRKSFSTIPSMKTKLEPIKYLALKTPEFFRGAAHDIVEKEPCVVFLDRELSKNTLNILTNHEDDVDELDCMLINKYLLEMGQEKYVLDLRDCDDDRLNSLLNGMDARAGEFNYIVVENTLGVWVYNTDEFTSIQID
jgi:hypothetical protein